MGDKMAKRRMKKQLIIKMGIVIFIILGLFIGYKYLDYRNSNEYKLKTIGYSKSETKTIIDKIDETSMKKILLIKYSDKLDDLIKQKYFIFKNLNRYLIYYKDNNDKSTKDIVAIVNTNNDRSHYEKIIKTDTSKGILMLINKYYALDNKYTPSNIVTMSLNYSYDGNSITKDVYTNFISMCKAAKLEGYTLVANASYRNYIDQKNIYDELVNNNGQDAADSFAARPGHSEHQTGLALDIAALGKSANFEQSEEYQWLLDNAYKYGFILRYPDKSEYLTGYKFEPWHYRYVGKDVASELKTLGITFDEYYAYYLK